MTGETPRPGQEDGLEPSTTPPTADSERPPLHLKESAEEGVREEERLRLLEERRARGEIEADTDEIKNAGDRLTERQTKKRKEQRVLEALKRITTKHKPL